MQVSDGRRCSLPTIGPGGTLGTWTGQGAGEADIGTTVNGL